MEPLSFGERITRSLWRVTPQRALSGIIGWGARCALPAPVRGELLRRFAGQYDIDVSEAEKPIEEYSGLQEFFTRRLKPGARLIDQSPDTVVSVADGRVVERGITGGGRLVYAKDAGFTLAALLADDDLARSLEGGPFEITYLSPRDYHRVHSPVAGKVVAWNYVPGTLFPVNDASVRREPGLFAKNERLVTVIDGEAGRCAVVMVAAVGVGHITTSYDPEVATHAERFDGDQGWSKKLEPAPAIERGGELGTFSLGSTTIVVFEPGRVTLDPIAPGTAARMGRPMGRIAVRGRSAQAG